MQDDSKSMWDKAAEVAKQALPNTEVGAVDPFTQSGLAVKETDKRSMWEKADEVASVNTPSNPNLSPSVSFRQGDSQYDQGLLPGMDANRNRAESQSVTSQIANRALRLTSGIPLEAVNLAGYIIDAPANIAGVLGFNPENDYQNAISTWAQKAKESNLLGITEENFPVYTSPDGNPEMNFGDSGWWVNTVGSMGESVLGFMLMGFGMGKLLGTLAEGLAIAGEATAGLAVQANVAHKGFAIAKNVLKATKLSGKALTNPFTNSALTAQSVAGLNASQVYNDTYNYLGELDKNLTDEEKIKRGLPLKMTDEYKAKIAGESAAGTYTFAAATSTLLNASGLSPFTRTARARQKLYSLPRNKAAGSAEKQMRNTIKAYDDVLSSPESIAKGAAALGFYNKMSNARGFAWEAFQEGTEELTENYAQHIGMQRAREVAEDVPQDFDILSPENILAFTLGAFGGGIVKGVGIGVDAYNKKSATEDYKKVITKNRNVLQKHLGLIQERAELSTKLQTEEDPKKIKKYKRKIDEIDNAVVANAISNSLNQNTFEPILEDLERQSNPTEALEDNGYAFDAARAKKLRQTILDTKNMFDDLALDDSIPRGVVDIARESFIQERLIGISLDEARASLAKRLDLFQSAKVVLASELQALKKTYNEEADKKAKKVLSKRITEKQSEVDSYNEANPDDKIDLRKDAKTALVNSINDVEYLELAKSRNAERYGNLLSEETREAELKKVEEEFNSMLKSASLDSRFTQISDAIEAEDAKPLSEQDSTVYENALADIRDMDPEVEGRTNAEILEDLKYLTSAEKGLLRRLAEIKAKEKGTSVEEEYVKVVNTYGKARVARKTTAQLLQEQDKARVEEEAKEAAETPEKGPKVITSVKAMRKKLKESLARIRKANYLKNNGYVDQDQEAPIEESRKAASKSKTQSVAFQLPAVDPESVQGDPSYEITAGEVRMQLKETEGIYFNQKSRTGETGASNKLPIIYRKSKFGSKYLPAFAELVDADGNPAEALYIENGDPGQEVFDQLYTTNPAEAENNTPYYFLIPETKPVTVTGGADFSVVKELHPDNTSIEVAVGRTKTADKTTPYYRKKTTKNVVSVKAVYKTDGKGNLLKNTVATRPGTAIVIIPKPEWAYASYRSADTALDKILMVYLLSDVNTDGTLKDGALPIAQIPPATNEHTGQVDETIKGLRQYYENYEAAQKAEVSNEVEVDKSLPTLKIISGGQTGADRIGLEVGKKLGIATGGVAPKGYNTEKGADKSLKKFGLTESLSSGYQARTIENLTNSDGTVIWGDTSSAGSKLTINNLKKLGKPYIENPSPAELKQFLKDNNIKTLNVAGNRGSKLTTKQQKEIKASLTAAFTTPVTQTGVTSSNSKSPLVLTTTAPTSKSRNIVNRKSSGVSKRFPLTNLRSGYFPNSKGGFDYINDGTGVLTLAVFKEGKFQILEESSDARKTNSTTVKFFSKVFKKSKSVIKKGLALDVPISDVDKYKDGRVYAITMDPEGNPFPVALNRRKLNSNKAYFDVFVKELLPIYLSRYTANSNPLASLVPTNILNKVGNAGNYSIDDINTFYKTNQLNHVGNFGLIIKNPAGGYLFIDNTSYNGTVPVEDFLAEGSFKASKIDADGKYILANKKDSKIKTIQEISGEEAAAALALFKKDIGNAYLAVDIKNINTTRKEGFTNEFEAAINPDGGQVYDSYNDYLEGEQILTTDTLPGTPFQGNAVNISLEDAVYLNSLKEERSSTIDDKSKNDPGAKEREKQQLILNGPERLAPEETTIETKAISIQGKIYNINLETGEVTNSAGKTLAGNRNERIVNLAKLSSGYYTAVEINGAYAVTNQSEFMVFDKTGKRFPVAQAKKIEEELRSPKDKTKVDVTSPTDNIDQEERDLINQEVNEELTEDELERWELDQEVSDLTLEKIANKIKVAGNKDGLSETESAIYESYDISIDSLVNAGINIDPDLQADLDDADQYKPRKAEPVEGYKRITAQEIDWFKKSFGEGFLNLAKDVDPIIHKGEHLWGYYYKGLVTLGHDAGEGTIHHEAFHLVFDLALNDSQRQKLYEEAVARGATDEDGKPLTLADKDALEEWMSNKFMEFKLNPSSQPVGSRLTKWFKRLWVQIQNFLGVGHSMQEVFGHFDEGPGMLTRRKMQQRVKRSEFFSPKLKPRLRMKTPALERKAISYIHVMFEQKRRDAAKAHQEKHGSARGLDAEMEKFKNVRVMFAGGPGALNNPLTIVHDIAKNISANKREIENLENSEFPSGLKSAKKVSTETKARIKMLKMQNGFLKAILDNWGKSEGKTTEGVWLRHKAMGRLQKLGFFQGNVVRDIRDNVEYFADMEGTSADFDNTEALEDAEEQEESKDRIYDIRPELRRIKSTMSLPLKRFLLTIKPIDYDKDPLTGEIVPKEVQFDVRTGKLEYEAKKDEFGLYNYLDEDDMYNRVNSLLADVPSEFIYMRLQELATQDPDMLSFKIALDDKIISDPDFENIFASFFQQTMKNFVGAVKDSNSLGTELPNKTTISDYLFNTWESQAKRRNLYELNKNGEFIVSKTKLNEISNDLALAESLLREFKDSGKRAKDVETAINQFKQVGKAYSNYLYNIGVDISESAWILRLTEDFPVDDKGSLLPIDDVDAVYNAGIDIFSTLEAGAFKYIAKALSESRDIYSTNTNVGERTALKGLVAFEEIAAADKAYLFNAAFRGGDNKTKHALQLPNTNTLLIARAKFTQGQSLEEYDQDPMMNPGRGTNSPFKSLLLESLQTDKDFRDNFKFYSYDSFKDRTKSRIGKEFSRTDLQETILFNLGLFRNNSNTSNSGKGYFNTGTKSDKKANEYLLLDKLSERQITTNMYSQVIQELSRVLDFVTATNPDNNDGTLEAEKYINRLKNVSEYSKNASKFLYFPKMGEVLQNLNLATLNDQGQVTSINEEVIQTLIGSPIQGDADMKKVAALEKAIEDTVIPALKLEAVNDFMENMEDNGLIKLKRDKKDKEGYYKIDHDGYGVEYPKNLYENSKESEEFIKLYALNTLFWYTESSKMFSGDLAFTGSNEKFYKRAYQTVTPGRTGFQNGNNSFKDGKVRIIMTQDPYKRNDSAMLRNLAQGAFKNNPDITNTFIEDIITKVNEYLDTTNEVDASKFKPEGYNSFTPNQKRAVGIIKTQVAVNKTDAQSWGSIEFYRDFMKGFGGDSWNTNHEALFNNVWSEDAMKRHRAEVADGKLKNTSVDAILEAAANGKISWYKNNGEILKITEDPQEWINKMTNKVNKIGLPPIKPFYFKNQYDPKLKRMVPVQFKTLIAPLTPHLAATNDDLQEMYDKMKESGAHIIATPTTVKVGSYDVVNSYKDINGDTTIHDIDINHLSLVLELGHKSNDRQIFGIQPAKMLPHALERDDAGKRKFWSTWNQAWFHKIANSERSLKEKLGIPTNTGISEWILAQQEGNGFNRKLYLRKLAAILNQEIDRLNKSQNYQEALELREYLDTKIETFAMPLDLPGFAKQFESLVNSLFRNNIMKQRMRVVGLTQVGNFAASDDLKYTHTVTDEKGNITVVPSEIAVPEHVIVSLLGREALQSIGPDGRLIGYDNDKRLLSMAYRIPNSSKKLMGPTKIVKVLPTGITSTVMLPPELAIQMGADYDADKLFLVLPEVDENFNYIGYDPEKVLKGQLSRELVAKEKATDVYERENNNYILDQMMEVLLDPNEFKNFVTPLLLDELEAHSVAMIEKRGLSKKANTSNAHTPSTNFLFETYNKFSKSGVGISANFSSAHAYFPFIKVRVKMQNTLEQTTKDGTFTFDGKLDRITTAGGVPILDILELWQNAFLDNANKPIAPYLNVNDLTINPLLTTALMGYDLDTTIQLLNQPIILELQKQYVINKNMKDAVDAVRMQAALSEDRNRYKDTKSGFKVTSDMLAEGMELINTPLTEMGPEQFQNQLRVLKVFEELYSVGENISNLTGLVKPEGAKDLTTYAKLEEYTSKLNKFKPGQNSNVYLEDFDDIFQENVNSENSLMKSPVPRLTAMYKAAIEGNLKFVGTADIFPYYTDAYREGKKKLAAALGLNYLRATDIETINNAFTNLIASGPLKNHFLEGYEWDKLLYSKSGQSLADELEDLKERFKGKLDRDPLFSRIIAGSYNKHKYLQEIWYNNTSSLLGDEQNQIIDAWASHLTNADYPSIQEFARKLIGYTVQTGGFDMSTRSFSHFIPADAFLHKNGRAYSFVEEFMRVKGTTVNGAQLNLNALNSDFFEDILEQVIRANPELSPRITFGKTMEAVIGNELLKPRDSDYIDVKALSTLRFDLQSSPDLQINDNNRIKPKGYFHVVDTRYKGGNYDHKNSKIRLYKFVKMDQQVAVYQEIQRLGESRVRTELDLSKKDSSNIWFKSTHGKNELSKLSKKRSADIPGGLPDVTHTSIQSRKKNAKINMAALEGTVQSEPVSKKLESKLRNFLLSVGFDFKVYDTLANRLDVQNPVAFADMFNKIVALSQTEEGMRALPEEVAHVYVEMLKSEEVLQELLNAVEGTPEYDEVLRDYSKIYNNDITKLKKEAAGKIIAKHLIKREPVPNNSLRGIMDKIKAAIIKLFEFVGLSKKVALDPFEQAAEGILQQKLENLDLNFTTDERSIYYKLSKENEAKFLNDLRENQKRIRISADESVYELLDEDGTVIKTLKRVSNYINDSDVDTTNPLVNSAIDIGNTVDTLVRDFFNGTLKSKLKDYKLTSGPDNVRVIRKFLRQLETLKTNLEARGERIIAEKLILHNEKLGIAGEIDLMSIDATGNVRIYDIKSMRGNQDVDAYKQRDAAGNVIMLDNEGALLEDVSKYESTQFGTSIKEKHQKQVSLYRILLNNTYGVRAKALAIMPVEVMYEEGDTTTSVLQLHNGRTVDPLNKVNDVTLDETFSVEIPISKKAEKELQKEKLLQIEDEALRNEGDDDFDNDIDEENDSEEDKKIKKAKRKRKNKMKNLTAEQRKALKVEYAKILKTAKSRIRTIVIRKYNRLKKSNLGTQGEARAAKQLLEYLNKGEGFKALEGFIEFNEDALTELRDSFEGFDYEIGDRKDLTRIFNFLASTKRKTEIFRILTDVSASITLQLEDIRTKIEAGTDTASVDAQFYDALEGINDEIETLITNAKKLNRDIQNKRNFIYRIVYIHDNRFTRKGKEFDFDGAVEKLQKGELSNAEVNEITEFLNEVEEDISIPAMYTKGLHTHRDPILSHIGSRVKQAEKRSADKHLSWLTGTNNTVRADMALENLKKVKGTGDFYKLYEDFIELEEVAYAPKGTESQRYKIVHAASKSGASLKKYNKLMALDKNDPIRLAYEAIFLPYIEKRKEIYKANRFSLRGAAYDDVPSIRAKNLEVLKRQSLKAAGKAFTAGIMDGFSVAEDDVNFAQSASYDSTGKAIRYIPYRFNSLFVPHTEISMDLFSTVNLAMQNMYDNDERAELLTLFEAGASLIKSRQIVTYETVEEMDPITKEIRLVEQPRISDTEGDQTRAYQFLEEMKNTFIFGEYMKQTAIEKRKKKAGEDGKVSRVFSPTQTGKTVLQAVSFKNLALNLTAITVNPMTQLYFAAMAGIGGRNYTLGQLLKSYGTLLKHWPQMIADYRSRVVKDKVSLLLQQIGVFDDGITDLSYSASKKLNFMDKFFNPRKLGFLGFKIGNALVQPAIALTMMKNTKFTLKNGSEISYFDAWEIDANSKGLKINPEVEEQLDKRYKEKGGGIAFFEESIAREAMRVSDIRKASDKGLAQKYLGLKAIGTHKSWMMPMIQNLWALPYENKQNQQFEVGSLLLAWKRLTSILTPERRAQMRAVGVGLGKLKANDPKYINPFTKKPYTEDELITYTTAMRQAYAHIATYTALFISTYVAFRDDEKEDNRGVAGFVKLLLLRLEDEAGGMLNPFDVLKIAKSPVAAVSTIDSLLEALWLTIVYAGKGSEIIETGPNKNKTRFRKAWEDNIPLYNQFKSLENIEYKIRAYESGIF